MIGTKYHKLDREKKNTDFIMIGTEYHKLERKKNTDFIMIQR